MQTLESAPETQSPAPHRIRLRIFASAVLTLLVALTGWYLADRYWPYRYRNVKPLLEGVLASKVTVREYHRCRHHRQTHRPRQLARPSAAP
jgi:hypothetical protein